MNLKKLLSSAASLAVAGTMLTLSSPPAAHALSGDCTKVFKKTENVTIPDNTPIGGTGWLALTVDDFPPGATILDVNIKVNIDHLWVEDVNIYTSDPNTASSVDLSSDNGGTGDNYTNTWFNSDAATSITDASAPFTGNYQPEQSLNFFDGMDPNRTYYLAATDDEAGFTGTLKNWSVELWVAGCDYDGDGKYDHVDKCDEIAANSPSGCPLVSRTLSLAYTSGAYRGLMGSSESACYAVWNVSVYKVRPGPDLKIGTALTNGAGEYALFKPRGSGKFYAKTKGSVVLDVAACRQAKSPYKNF